MRARRCISIAVVSIALTGFLATAARAAGETPPNDNRADAALLTALPTVAQVDTTGATNELGEAQDCAAMSNSVWWRVTLPAPTDLRISTQGSDFDTVVAVYLDTPTGDEFVMCDDESGGNGTSRLTFTTEPGATYVVQVGGWIHDSGDLRIEFSQAEPLNNDAFADAYPLAGQAFEIDASTDGATKEAGEPLPCDRLLIERTVWFTWTATATGDLTLYAGQRVLGIYRGATLDTLESVGCGVTYTDTRVVAGETYAIQVGVNDLGATGMFNLWGWLDARNPSTANDNLGDAETIDGLNDFHVSNIADATLEPNESSCASTSKTLWYRYTATEDGPLVASTERSDTDTTLGVYTGATYDDLTLVACNDDGVLGDGSRASFLATAGETYLIQVGQSEDSWRGNEDIRVGVLAGASLEAGVAKATVTVVPDEYTVNEVGVQVDGSIAGAGVRHHPDHDAVCAFAVVLGICTRL